MMFFFLLLLSCITVSNAQRTPLDSIEAVVLNQTLQALGCFDVSKCVSTFKDNFWCNVTQGIDIVTKCESNHLTELALENFKLTGTIPTVIASLSRLSVLELQYNELKGTVPSAIALLQSLERFDVHSNQLNGSVSFLKNITTDCYLQADEPTEQRGNCFDVTNSASCQVNGGKCVCWTNFTQFCPKTTTTTTTTTSTTTVKASTSRVSFVETLTLPFTTLLSTLTSQTQQSSTLSSSTPPATPATTTTFQETVQTGVSVTGGVTNDGAVIGGAVCGIVALLFTLGLVAFLIVRSRRRRRDDPSSVVAATPQQCSSNQYGRVPAQSSMRAAGEEEPNYRESTLAAKLDASMTTREQQSQHYGQTTLALE